MARGVLEMRIGCVGTGVMGREIIRHLVTAGNDVAAFDHDANDAFLAGANWMPHQDLLLLNQAPR